MTFRAKIFCAATIAVLGLTISTSARAGSAEVLATSRSGGTLDVFDNRLNKISTVILPMGANPVAIAINPAGTLAAVSNFTTNRVDFVDLTVSPPALAGPSVITTPLFPEDAVFSPNGACLVVSDGKPGYVASIGVTNRDVASAFPGLQSQAVEFIPNNSNNLVLTADLTNDEIHVLTLGAGCTLSVAGAAVAMPKGSGPRNISALPNGKGALVANNDGTVGVLGINGATVSSLSSFDLPNATPGSASTARVQTILVNSHGSRAYAFQCKEGNIEVLKVGPSNKVSDSGVGIKVSTSFCLLGAEQVATDGPHIFVSTNPSNTPDNTVSGITEINVPSNQVTGSVMTVDPEGIAVLRHPRKPPA